MPTYLITYYGASGPPPSPESRDQMMAAFQAWVASVGDHMIDPGAPVGPAKTVSSGGVTDGAAEAQVGGYSVIWSTPGSLEAVTSGKVGVHGRQEAASR